MLLIDTILRIAERKMPLTVELREHLYESLASNIWNFTPWPPGLAEVLNEFNLANPVEEVHVEAPPPPPVMYVHDACLAEKCEQGKAWLNQPDRDPTQFIFNAEGAAGDKHAQRELICNKLLEILCAWIDLHVKESDKENDKQAILEYVRFIFAEFNNNVTGEKTFYRFADYCCQTESLNALFEVLKEASTAYPLDGHQFYPDTTYSCMPGLEERILLQACAFSHAAVIAPPSLEEKYAHAIWSPFLSATISQGRVNDLLVHTLIHCVTYHKGWSLIENIVPYQQLGKINEEGEFSALISEHLIEFEMNTALSTYFSARLESESSLKKRQRNQQRKQYASEIDANKFFLQEAWGECKDFLLANAEDLNEFGKRYPGVLDLILPNTPDLCIKEDQRSELVILDNEEAGRVIISLEQLDAALTEIDEMIFIHYLEKVHKWPQPVTRLALFVPKADLFNIAKELVVPVIQKCSIHALEQSSVKLIEIAQERQRFACDLFNDNITRLDYFTLLDLTPEITPKIASYLYIAGEFDSYHYRLNSLDAFFEFIKKVELRSLIPSWNLVFSQLAFRVIPEDLTEMTIVFLTRCCQLGQSLEARLIQGVFETLCRQKERLCLNDIHLRKSILNLVLLFSKSYSIAKFFGSVNPASFHLINYCVEQGLVEYDDIKRELISCVSRIDKADFHSPFLLGWLCSRVSLPFDLTDQEKVQFTHLLAKHDMMDSSLHSDRHGSMITISGLNLLERDMESILKVAIENNYAKSLVFIINYFRRKGDPQYNPVFMNLLKFFDERNPDISLLDENALKIKAVLVLSVACSEALGGKKIRQRLVYELLILLSKEAELGIEFFSDLKYAVDQLIRREEIEYHVLMDGQSPQVQQLKVISDACLPLLQERDRQITENIYFQQTVNRLMRFCDNLIRSYPEGDVKQSGLLAVMGGVVKLRRDNNSRIDYCSTNDLIILISIIVGYHRNSLLGPLFHKSTRHWPEFVSGYTEFYSNYQSLRPTFALPDINELTVLANSDQAKSFYKLHFQRNKVEKILKMIRQVTVGDLLRLVKESQAATENRRGASASR